MDNPIDVLGGIEADVGDNYPDNNFLRVAGPRESDVPALQITDATN